MDNFLIYGLLPMIGLMSSILSYMLAERKRLNIIFWVLLGFVFGPITLVILTFVRRPTNAPLPHLTER